MCPKNDLREIDPFSQPTISPQMHPTDTLCSLFGPGTILCPKDTLVNKKDKNFNPENFDVGGNNLKVN